MDNETKTRLSEIEARMRSLEAAAADPWASTPTALDPPGPKAALEGPHLFPDEDEGFWGEIVTDATGGAYTFKEKYRADATTWADLTGGRTGTAYEANVVAGIAVGKKIRVREECDATGTLRYVFDWATSFGLAGGPAEGLTVRYTITGNGTATVSGADWRRGMIWASLVGVNAESAAAADQYPGLWDGGTFWKTAFSGAALFPGEYNLINEQIGAGVTVRLYVDDADSGKLKLTVTNYAFVQHVVLGLIRFDTRTASDAGTIG